MLGFLHKRALGLSHPGVAEALPLRDAPGHGWHNKHLESFFTSVCCHARLYERGLFAFVLIYNRLPQFLVDEENVSGFQTQLNTVAKCRATCGDPSWRDSFQSCMDVMNTFH